MERSHTPDSDPVPTFQKVEAVLIDMPERGFLLPVLYQLRDDHWILIGRQKEILEQQNFLEEKKFRTIAYFNMNIYGNTVDMGQEIVDILERYYLLRVRGTVWNNGHLLVGARSRIDHGSR